MKTKPTQRNIPGNMMLRGSVIFILLCLLSAGYCFSQPTIACPSNQTRSTNANVCTYTTIGTEFNPLSYNGTGTTTISYTLTGVTVGNGTTTLAGVVFNKGITTVTWTVHDTSPNTASCSFTVTVNDNQPPVITCPGSQVVTVNNGNSYIVAGTQFDPLSWSDNCPGATIMYILSGATTSAGSNTVAGAILNVGITTVCWYVTDASGNTGTCCLPVTVNPITGIDEINNNLISINPNPANDNLTIEATASINETISIYNIQGRLLMQQPMLKAREEINISRFAKGMYIIKLRNNNGIAVKKFIKE